MIHIKNLHKRYGNHVVLRGVDLRISKQGIFAVLGPNGSGKTTLIKCILGMVLPDKGGIYVKDISVKNNRTYRHDVDYLPQVANFPGNLTVRELIRMVKDLSKKNADNNGLIKLFGLRSSLDKKFRNLSGGTKQKVNVLQCFMFDSPYIILDEPTSGLDPIALLHLKKLIWKKKAEGKIIIITSHIMGFIEAMADEIVFLLEGKIYFKGTIDALKRKTTQQDLEHAIASILDKNYV